MNFVLIVCTIYSKISPSPSLPQIYLNWGMKITGFTSPYSWPQMVRIKSQNWLEFQSDTKNWLPTISESWRVLNFIWDEIEKGFSNKYTKSLTQKKYMQMNLILYSPDFVFPIPFKRPQTIRFPWKGINKRIRLFEKEALTDLILVCIWNAGFAIQTPYVTLRGAWTYKWPVKVSTRVFNINKFR